MKTKNKKRCTQILIITLAFVISCSLISFGAIARYEKYYEDSPELTIGYKVVRSSTEPGELKMTLIGLSAGALYSNGVKYLVPADEKHEKIEAANDAYFMDTDGRKYNLHKIESVAPVLFPDPKPSDVLEWSNTYELLLVEKPQPTPDPTPAPTEDTLTKDKEKLRVEKVVASVLVNRRDVRLKDKSCTASIGKKTKVRVKITPTKGWKISAARIVCGKGKKTVKLPKKGLIKKLKKGSKILFPKKYKSYTIKVTLKKGTQKKSYNVNLKR